MDEDAFYQLVEAQLKETITRESVDLKAVAKLAQTRLETLNDISDLIDFFEAVPEYDKGMYNHKRMKTNPENSVVSLKAVLPLLEAEEDYGLDHLHEVILGFVKEQGMKNGQMLWPLRTALSGKASTPGGAFDIMSILGKEESVKRIKDAIAKLEKELAE